MANLTESETWEAGIYQLETTDPVLGGPDGIDNRQAKQLANRTSWLKKLVETVQAALGNYAPLAAPVFTGDPRAPTPARFDNDTSLATTEFVKRAGLGFPSFRTITASTTLTAADAGSAILFGGNGGAVLTLPAANTVPAGGTITVASFTTYAASNTISTQNNDSMGGALAQSRTSGTIRANDSITFVSDGSGNWAMASECSAEFLNRIFVFNQSIGSNSGYQRLPGGLIMQWGTSTSGVGGALITYPISFPNGLRSLVSSDTGSECARFGMEYVSLSQFKLYAKSDSNAPAVFQSRWVAIGF